MRTLLFLFIVVFAPLLAVCQLVNNYDTCRTQMYYQYIGNPARETYIEKARTVQDNGIISAGYLKQAGSQDALIIKQDQEGKVIWQKVYGTAAYDEKFTDWRELPNRQLLISGIAKDRVTLQSFFFMMQMTYDGNIIWQRSYADIAASSNITNAKIYPDYYGEYFFAAETDSSIIYGMVSNTGALNWQKTLTVKPGTKLIGAVSFYSQLSIATNAIDSGYHVSNFYYVNYYWTGHPKTIKYTIKLGGPHQNCQYILHDYEQYELYTYYSGIRSVNNGPYEIIRVNIDQGYIRQALETIITPGVAIDSLTRSAINIYGDAISFTSGRKNDRLNLIRLTGSENIPTYVISSSSYHLPDSILLKGNVKTWDDGYMFFGFQELAGGNKRVIQLKTDSATISPACISRQGENFNVVRDAFPTDTVRYTYNNLHGLLSFNYNASANSGIIDTVTICRELKCPLIPLSDSCVDSYQKLYKSYDPGSGSTDIQIINGRTFVSGIYTPIDYVPEWGNSFIVELNGNGQVIHQKKFVIGNKSYTHMFKGQDSSMLLYGYSKDPNYDGYITLAKIDTNLNVLWMRSLRLRTFAQASTNQAYGEVKQGSDGSYFIQYSDGIDFGATMVYLTKLDVNGNLLWSKVYKASDPGYLNFIKGRRLEVSGGSVYIMCDNEYNAYRASILLKVSETNGALQWCKKYSDPGENLGLTGLMYMYNNELLIGGGFSNSSTSYYEQNILLKANPDGNVLNAVSLKDITSNILPPMDFMQQHSGGNFYISSSFYSSPPTSNPYHINVTIGNSFNIITSKKRPAILNSRSSATALGPGGQLYETGGYITGLNYDGLMYVIKFGADGRAGTCPSDSLLLQQVAAPAISVTDIPCIQSDTNFALLSPIYRIDQSFLATARLLCSSVPGCNSIDVTGSDSICDRSLQYTFHAVRNNGCTAPVQWLFDNTNAQLINQTDSSITIHFLIPGNWLLKARLTSSCTAYSDSLLIHVMNDAPVLNLGRDTSLCPGASLVLHAKKGFLSYHWQDGSTDSTFTVTAAGIYYVTVADSCNNLFTDSIHVLINGGHVLNLGPDSNFCNTNSILLNAHTGFLSYHWQDGSTDSVFTVTVPGVYFVTVTDSCGNSITDTIKIRSYRRASSLNLGPDRTFCAALPIQLDAGAGFQQYLWQDGSIDSVFTVQNAGLYYVTVKDSCGAVFTDSIRILPDNIIVFDIGPNTSVCRSDSLLLQVTTGLNNYTWWPLVNLIPQSPTAVTVFPGSSTWYHVSAMKVNGCTVTDSILVDVNVPPGINLGIDTSLCKGDTLRLNAGNGFNNYTWSTGEHTASIGVYQAGQYFVSATDNNNCKSRDSITILQIIPLPVTGLPLETAICLGEPKTLSAGVGFSSYLWNTGAFTESIVVTSMGQYWVTVTNSRGCSNTDSVNIDRELPVPADFIQNEAGTICTYETLTIAPVNNYVSYLWSTGSVAQSIAINDPGDYWLKVTDINGCVGSDSFKLATKNCNDGVYFPNSFTPNNDGTNDTYKAKAYGVINSYHLVIYNRYGERLFESWNINEGWDGSFKGVKQGIGNFVWQCWYQLGHFAMEYKSGSLLLIR